MRRMNCVPRPLPSNRLRCCIPAGQGLYVRADDGIRARDPLCRRRSLAPISLSRAEYEAIREVPGALAIALNHENPEMDSVSFETERYAAVHNIYRPAVVTARATDPRRQ